MQIVVSSMILYEDKDLLLCHKPAGLAVQNARVGAMDLESALKNELAARMPGKMPYLGVVHRLDQPVEGVVVFAKHPKAAGILSAQLTDGRMKKEYLALSSHGPVSTEGILEDLLIKDGRAHLARIVPAGTSGAKKARLSYKLLGEADGQYLYAISLDTGRYHQIRVQMAGAGMPLVGDRKYNGAECESGSGNVALCAYRLTFMHPRTQKMQMFQIRPQNPAFAAFSPSLFEGK